MNRKKVSLVINPREGQNIAKITDVLAVLAAAGWDTRLLLKKYGGETVNLATKAVKKGAELVVSYGGDGTLNQVVNGVLQAKGKSIVGLIPGGTANEWAGEMHIPTDPVKATLALVNSKLREVDVGHVDVQELIFPAAEEGQSSTPSDTIGSKQGRRKKEKAPSKAKHDFLMMAGLGFDARVIGHTSNQLKHKIGPLAFDIAAAKTLSKQHSFPVEIWDGGVGERAKLLWKGDALQIIVANTRTYANMVQIADDATLDDGVIDLCVISGGDPLSVIGQFTSIVLQHKPDDVNTQYFRSAHFSIRVPASVLLQLDGSAVKLKDYIRKSDGEALQKEDLGRVIVNYRFDAFPKAVKMLVPSSYDDTLFQKHQPAAASTVQHETKSVFSETPKEGKAAQKKRTKPDVEQPRLEALLDNGRKVIVIGGAPNPAKKYHYILAGGEIKQATGDSCPVAVLIDHKTAITNMTGQHIAPSALEQLQEGESIVVTGKKSKRGVIHAEHVII